MKNKSIFRLLLWLALAPWLACSTGGPATTASEPSQPYNILFIAVDDLNDWTGFLGGHPQTLTPNMDRLAREGMVFERAYCAASVCNPSRAAIMSGFRPSTSGIYHNGEDMFEAPLIRDGVMLPQYLSRFGYKTLSRGKIYHTPATGKHTWEVWSPVSGAYGKAAKAPGRMANGIPTGEMADNMDWGPTDAALEETPDFLNADWAARQLQQDHDRPFFLACGIFRPHLKWHVPREFFDKFDPETLTLPLVKEDDLEDVSAGVQQATREYRTIKKHGKEAEAVRAYLASINYADACIGHLLDALERSPYRDNTIVVLWGDHGWHLGEKLRYKKFTLWEEACRMPLIIKAPGITPAGSRCERTVNLLDLYPTLTDLANLPTNQQNDGRSLVPLLQDPETAWDFPSLTQMGEGRNSLRTERFRYLRYEDGSEELYDHRQDPREWNNLSEDPAYQNDKNQLAEKMNALLAAKGTSNE
ncbi:sulfatase [Flavilitoribacter nigricans]|uniref:Iduronate-2-sulfatase n=1 Tax=Flavilitoribacter nigricans (strain ATCC 23147 / DSM 23189 / NBRC 102662 / NCIMB 1420 / SS-2) TaxID=1122177 RepID=A0A2D0N0Q2_FLAN2|nr:sulfatase [Flavilitoribacter nigricans]PHN02132.1 iduronate-2-sulfatase [Flavilitoribacter nigricans DSM 23189 = NBRC 102662]